LPAELAPGPCGKCLIRPPFQQQTRSLFLYRGAVRDAVLQWKLAGDEAAVRWLIRSSEEALRTVFDSRDLLLPVPMPLSRMRHYGHHHAANLTRWIAEMVGCCWEWRVLRRNGEQPRQSSLAGRARRRNLSKAFVVRNDQLLRLEHGLGSDSSHGRIWIVDDILTTGATLHHCAAALRGLHRPIHVFSLARK